MLVTVQNMFNGELNQMDLPVTVEQLETHQRGGLVQNIFPNLTTEQREFLITGLTPEKWDAIFGEEE